MLVVLSVYGGLGLGLALNPNPNPQQTPRAMPVVLSVYGGCQLMRRLCLYSCTRKMYIEECVFCSNFLLRMCCTEVAIKFEAP